MSRHCIEIDRKFLVVDDSWRKTVSSSHKTVQGYICTEPEHCVRVRVVAKTAYITIKGKSGPSALERPEFEFDIPIEQADKMLTTFCVGRVIEKIRHLVDFASKTWEIDEFIGRHAGLVVAEIELNNAEEKNVMPAWVRKEVTNDPLYANSSLALQ